jgi:hypothetical protein
MASALPLLITPIGLCKHRDRFCRHDARTYRHVRDMGYSAVIFGFLDQWDEDLSFLEFYGRSEAVPGLVPADYREKNRAELRRRLAITRDLGLSVYLSIASPLGPKSKMALDNRDPMQSGGSYPGGFADDPRGQFGQFLGPDEELCVSHPAVRRFYDELIADIVASFPEIRGFSIFGGDFYSSMCRAGACPRCGGTPAWRRFALWVDELTRAARAVRPGVEMYLVNWPWWAETFDMLAVTDPSVGFVISSAWGRETRQDQCPLEVWEALAANLEGVAAGYERALHHYGRAVARATAGKADEAAFHRDGVELGRSFHVLGRHTRLAHLARRAGRAVDTPVLCEAIGNLERVVALSDRVGTFEYRRDWYVEAIANMRREVRRRGRTPP